MNDLWEANGGVSVCDECSASLPHSQGDLTATVSDFGEVFPPNF